MVKYELDYAGRVNDFQVRMSDRGIDCALLFERGNLRYLTGWQQNPSSFSLLVISDDEIGYFVPTLDFNAAKNECWINSEDIYQFEEDPLDEVRNGFDLSKNDVMGIEIESILSIREKKIKRDSSAELRDINPIISELRAVKSDEEIALYREGAEKTSEVMRTIMDELKPGMREREISARAKYLMETLGGEGQSFEPFAMSGSNSWMPHRSSTSKRLNEGDSVLLDMGTLWYGYSTDMTRTFMIGQPSQEQEKAFAAVVKAQQTAIATLGPHVKAETVHDAAVNKLKEYGLNDYFPHLTGHGVGCDIHETPIIDAGQDIELQPGMITTIEPGVYKKGVGGIRLEDMVLITKTGQEILTDAPRDLSDLTI